MDKRYEAKSPSSEKDIDHAMVDMFFAKGWHSDIETGVYTIDQQHRVLFDLVMRTHPELMTGIGVSLEQTLDLLRSYADYHFDYEETWLQQHTGGLEESLAHAKNHARLFSRLLDFEARHRRGDLGFGELHRFLQEWLVSHILYQDIPVMRGGRPPESL